MIYKIKQYLMRCDHPGCEHFADVHDVSEEYARKRCEKVRWLFFTYLDWTVCYCPSHADAARLIDIIGHVKNKCESEKFFKERSPAWAYHE